MQAQKSAVPRRCVPRTLATVLSMAGAGIACAEEPSPWYVGASQAVTHDSNVYRAPNKQSDTYSSTGLLGGFDQPVSRQRFYGAANVRYNKYGSQSTLDNTSYGVNAGWDWATIEKLSGTLGGYANQNLASFDNNATVPITTRNILKTDQVSATARWGGDGLLTLDTSYAHSRVRYSAPEYLASTSDGDSASVGATYRFGPDLRVGTGFRYSRTKSPFAVALVAVPTGPDDYQPNTSHGRNLDLTMAWATTAQTGVNARLSWTRQSNSGVSGRDFSGLTGSLAANYTPTAKLAFSASAGRDAGTYASFFNFPTRGTATPVSGLSENSQTTDTYALGASYAATAKIAVNASLQYGRARLVDSVAVGGAGSSSERDDITKSAALGVSWAIARSVQLGCNVSHSSRRTTGANGFGYNDDLASCSAQFTLR
jgi:hypothetical protein